MKHLICAFLLCLPLALLAGEPERTSLLIGQDPTLKLVVKGRAGNMELSHSGQATEGHANTEYREGSGFASFDRNSQTLTFKPHTKFTFNRLSSHIEKIAPYMWAYLPKSCVLDLNVKVNSMGFGSMNLKELSVSALNLDVRYGDIDMDFATENQAIFRGTAKFHIHYGDLELVNLGNLKASKVEINGGAGEVSVDFGPKLYSDMEVKFDQDLGNSELSFPKGTRVVISGTSRDLTAFGFKKVGESWEPESYSDQSPTLNLKVRGPMGELALVWK